MSNANVTPFQKAVQNVSAGKQKTPSVSAEGKQIDYFSFQLATHHFNLKLMAKGMTFRHILLKDLKAYYGLKGRTAADCLPQFEAILTEYKNKLAVSHA